MSTTGDAAAAALAATFQVLVAAIPEGWVDRTDGVLAGVTGVPIPSLNGVWTESLTCSEATVGSYLDTIAKTGFPYGLQVRPGIGWHAARLAAERGLVREEDTPLMALVEGAALNSADVPAGVSIRELPADEAALHARVAALGFEAPEWMFAQFLTPSVLALPGVRCYVAEQGDEAVATGLGVTAGDSVAIFNIATPTEHRRNGYGAAVTARAVSDGLMAGADWAWLQSSPAGLGVYQRLGFEVVETWQCWASQV